MYNYCKVRYLSYFQNYFSHLMRVIRRQSRKIPVRVPFFLNAACFFMKINVPFAQHFKGSVSRDYHFIFFQDSTPFGSHKNGLKYFLIQCRFYRDIGIVKKLYGVHRRVSLCGVIATSESDPGVCTPPQNLTPGCARHLGI